MTATDDAARAQDGSVAFDLDLPHAPATVWRALTDPALLAEWLLPVVGLSLEPGAAFTFRAPPQPGWDGTVHCRLVAIDAPRTLTYTWIVGDLDTVVTFTLAPTPTGTRLSLVQSGFTPAQRRNLAGARYGWTMMRDRLVALLARLP